MQRLDAHMERGNRIMERSNEIMERNEEAFRDLRDYLAVRTVALGRLGQEFTLEMRAQRQALFLMLDRLGGNGGPVGGGAP
jgi:hypothetical protein